MDYYIDKIEGDIKDMIQTCFPSYRGKKVSLSTMIPTRLDSYWDGGSKRSYVFYELATKKTYNVASNHPMFDKGAPNKLDKLPKGIVIVSHSYFCGKDMGIEIYVNADDMAPMLPETTNKLINNEKIVLEFTSRYKNSYGGESNIRYKEAYYRHKITQEDWNKAKESLINNKLLRKNGSITPAGRNAIAR